MPKHTMTYVFKDENDKVLLEVDADSLNEAYTQAEERLGYKPPKFTIKLNRDDQQWYEEAG